MALALIKQKISYIRQHTFLNNLAILQVGNVIFNVAQAIMGIALTRVLQPENFGIYALSAGLANLFSLFLGVGAQDAVRTIVGETYEKKDRHTTKEALAFLLKISIITGVIAILLMLSLPFIATHFYHNIQIGFYAQILIVALVVSGLILPLALIGLQIIGDIRGLMLLNLTDQLARPGLGLLFAFLGFGVVGAITGQVLGAGILLVVALIVWQAIIARDAMFGSLGSLFAEMRRVSLRKYLGFSIWVAVDRNIGNLFMILPVLLIGLYVTTTEVTFFKVSFAYVNLALSLLVPISILLNVEFPKLKVTNREKLGPQFAKISLYSLGFSALLTSGAILVAPFLFRVVYGQNFLPGMNYVYAFFVYGALFGIGVGLGPMWRAVNEVKISILINVSTLAIGVPTALLLIKKFGVLGGIIAVTLWITISHFASFFYILKTLRNY